MPQSNPLQRIVGAIDQGDVPADDEPTLARLDVQVDVGGDAQAAECLAELVDGERTHCVGSAGFGSALAASTTLLRRRNARQPCRHSRAVPGTRPSGIRMTMATKIAPSRKFQRSM